METVKYISAPPLSGAHLTLCAAALAGEFRMVTIQCDVCGKQRTRDGAELWILGFDVPAASAPMRRSLKFLQRWEERRVLDPGAVHFCCEECRNTYVENATAA